MTSIIINSDEECPQQELDLFILEKIDIPVGTFYAESVQDIAELLTGNERLVVKTDESGLPSVYRLQRVNASHLRR